MTARWFSLCTTAALVAAPLGAARAQTTTDTTVSRYTVEIYLAEYSFDGPKGFGREGLGGFGARVMFGRAGVTKTLSSLIRRARAGAFLTYTSKQKNITTLNLGGEADFPLFRAPVVNGYLDPFVSLSAGLFRTSIDKSVFGGNIPPGFSASQTRFALTPAAGTLVPITGAINFRGDLRDVIVFNTGKTSNNLLAEGGISVGF